MPLISQPLSCVQALRSLAPLCLMASSSADQPSNKKSRKTENQIERGTMACFGTRGVSNAALRAIANKLEPQNSLSRRFIIEAPRARFNEVKRDIMLPLVTGEEHRWPVADPSIFVAMSTRDSQQMEDVFAS